MAMILSGDGTISGLQAGGLPDATITQTDLAPNVAGNGPVFSAYASGGTVAFTSSAYTKVPLNTEEFDIGGGFDNTTNYRFQPNEAGYYPINAGIDFGSAGITIAIAAIYKNGALYKMGNRLQFASGVAEAAPQVTALVYLNGTTDYVELFGYVAATTSVIYASPMYTYMQGYLARAA